MATIAPTALLAVWICSSTLAQQVTVPASADLGDANASALLPGSGGDVRWQTVLDAVVIPPSALGQSLTGITFRRDERSRPERLGGIANVTITLSRASRSAAYVSPVFDDNHATDPASRIVVYQGPWNIPFTSSTNGRTVSWQNAEDVVGVTFSTPFLYTGGSLCIEIVATRVAGSESRNWPIDAVLDPASGSVARVGQPCGPFTVAKSVSQQAAALISPRELVAGSTASFVALGEVGNLTALAIGFSPLDVDLAAVGIGAPGCRLRVDPVVSVMTALQSAAPLSGGHARVDLALPASPSVLGVTFLAQFLEFTFPITASEALSCTISSGIPMVGGSILSASLDGGSIPTSGRVWNARMPVVQLRL